MAKLATGVWEADDGTLFRTQDEAVTKDSLSQVLHELDKFDTGWNGKQPVDVVKYLLTRYNFVTK